MTKEQLLIRRANKFVEIMRLVGMTEKYGSLRRNEDQYAEIIEDLGRQIVDIYTNCKKEKLL